eukprot:Skav222411  [mRNA]  locus=scaffold4005:165517:166375:+ [translate_table: standard]
MRRAAVALPLASGEALGDPACWIGDITYDTCCLPPPHGKVECWDTTYTYQRCCTHDIKMGPVDINAVEEIAELGGCELNIFQEFKARSGAWYRNGTPNLVLFQEFGYIARRFESMYRTAIAAAPQPWLTTGRFLYRCNVR